jgi:hypothetical protein
VHGGLGVYMGGERGGKGVCLCENTHVVVPKDVYQGHFGHAN